MAWGGKACENRMIESRKRKEKEVQRKNVEANEHVERKNENT